MHMKAIDITVAVLQFERLYLFEYFRVEFRAF